jgi:hypothetical protein
MTTATATASARKRLATARKTAIGAAYITRSTFGRIALTIPRPRSIRATGIANATATAAGIDLGTAVGMADGAITLRVIVILETGVVILGGTIALADTIAERSPAQN